MKKFIRILLILLVVFTAIFLALNEGKPKGQEGQAAEALTDKMWAATSKSAWDSLAYVAWSFRGGHHYVWDRLGEKAEIKWDDYRVMIDLATMNIQATKAGEELDDKESKQIQDKGWAYWCNDSFWLNAPAKARDDGTRRSLVKTDEGDALLVEYSSGGVTPGDAYLWILDENGRPTSYKMWVSIIPIGGVEASWENWTSLDGALLAQTHQLGPIDVSIENLRGGQTPADIGLEAEYFSVSE